MYDYNVKLKDRAKQLRRDMTPWERHLWYDFLRTYEVKIYRQKMIGNFIADFCCSKAKLVIELDGSGHYQEEQKARDKERTVELEKLGFSVIRIADNDIDNNFYGVCEYIDKEIRKRLKPLRPMGTSPNWEAKRKNRTPPPYGHLP